MVRHALVRIQVMLVVGLLLPSASATGNDHVATLDDAPTDAARGAAGTGVQGLVGKSATTQTGEMVVAPATEQQAGFKTGGEMRDDGDIHSNMEMNNAGKDLGESNRAGGAPEYSYGDTTWEKDPKCTSGLNQSPLDLKRPYFGAFMKLELKYKDYEWPIQQNDGLVLKVPFKDDGSALKIGDKEYKPVEAVFRSPSEHKLNGKPYDMEMQILHTDSVGNQIQLAVVMEVTDKLPQEFYIENVFGHFFADLPKFGREKRIENMNLKWILNEKMLSHYIQYHGSLTHPPCSEGVEWFVLGKPWLIEKKWFDAYNKVFKGNARPVQATNDRILRSF